MPTNFDPILTCRHKAVPLAINLTESQRKAITSLYAQVPTILASLSLPAEEVSILSKWADEGTCRRVLNAVNFQPEAAITRLKATMKWRSEFKPDRISPMEIEVEAQSGKIFLNGFDRQGRPILIGIQRLDVTRTYDRYLKLCVYMTEKAIAIMPQGVEKLALFLDNSGLGLMNGPPMSFLTKFVGIMDAHYPGRLGVCILIHPSWFVTSVYALISPFLDDYQKSKVYFANPEKDGKHVEKRHGDIKEIGGWTNLGDWVSSEDLLVQYGGTCTFEYRHDVYWPKLVSITDREE